jgi:hypothetical protein
VTVTSPTDSRRGIGTRLWTAVDRLEDERVCWVVLLSAMTGYAALAMWLTRGTTLFFDETNIFVVDRGLSPDALLAPLNGHLVLLQRLIYAVNFELFGAEFVVVRVVEAVGVLLVVGLVFVLAKRRIGPAAALAPALLLLFFGSAWELNLVVSGIGNVYAVAAGLGALLALERPDPRRELLACALLTVAVASFTLGLAFAIGVVVLLLLQPDRRGHLWVPLVPLALYVAWFVWVRAVYVPDHGEVQNFEVWNVLLIPNFVADAAASLAGALAGLNYDFQPQDLIPVFRTDSAYGPLLAALAAFALGVRIWRGARSPLLWALIAALLAFWVALALGFGTGRNPTVVRYTYGGAVLAILIAAEAARGVRFSRTALLALFAVTALALGANLARLREGANFYRELATSLRAELTAIELARGHVGTSFLPSSGALNTVAMRAGPYLDAVQRNGSPAYSTAELSEQPETRRSAADAVLVSALGIAIAPGSPAGRVGNCRQVAGTAGSSRTLAVRPPGVRLTSPTGGRIALGRFASAASVQVGSLPARRPVDLRIPDDRSSLAWRASVTPEPASLTVCELRAG